MADEDSDNESKDGDNRDFGLQRKDRDVSKVFYGKTSVLGAGFTPRAIAGWTPREADAPADDRLYLAKHKQTREKDEAVKTLVRKGIKQDRFCGILDDEDVDSILEQMEFFKFATNEHVVKQGCAGYYFFVVQEGAFKVVVDDKDSGELAVGAPFGGIALIHACARTATVLAKEPSGIWGVDATTFRRVLLANSLKHHEENHRFLDSISLFDGLDVDQKEHVTKLAIFTESFEQGDRVVSQGQPANAIYFVRKGNLSVYEGGSFDASGQFSGGELSSQLRAGDRFGERSVLYEELTSKTIIADSSSVLLCIGAKQLHDVLGQNLPLCLENSFIVSQFRKMPMISHLSGLQRNHILQAIEIKGFGADQLIQDPDEEAKTMQLAIVIKGSMIGSRNGAEVTINRGEWCGDDAFGQNADQEETPAVDAESSKSEVSPKSKGSPKSTASPSSPSNRNKAVLTESLLDSVGCASISTMTAGPDGARVALLSTGGLVNAFRAIGLTAIGGSVEALDYMREVMCAKKVPIFRGLSPDQINNCVSALVWKSYNAGALIIRQGDVGSEFFIISKGSVNVKVNGEIVRTYGKNSCFGEGALLFDTPRSASIEAIEDGTELWCLGKQAFDEVVSENMRKELEYRITLQSTSVTMKLISHVRLIGAGSFGSVRLVEHKYTNIQYALKRIKKEDGEVPEDVLRECALLSELDHPFILQMVKTFFTDHSIYILTELITGGQLHEQLQRMGVLTRKQAQFYVGSLVLILEYLHEMNVVFRDLKPENVMLDPQGYLKLVDFGLAKKLDQGQTYTLVGTLFYLAPEIIEGHGYTISVDLWALGVMFFEFVCGYVPFGDNMDDEQEILGDIMTGPLEFPSKYNDNAGKKLLGELLNRCPSKRSGINGFTDIKKHKYFQVRGENDLFSQIIGRELEAPVVPCGDTYTSEREMEGKISLSDAEELAD